MTAPVLYKKKFYIIKPYGGHNYIKNPSFTEPVGVTYWTGTQAAIAVTGDQQRRGAYSMKVTPVSGKVSYAAYAGLAVTAGLAYTFSCDVKGVAGQAMRIYIGAYTATTFTATGYWQRIQVTTTIPSGVTTTFAVVQRDSTASAEPFYVDGAQFEQTVVMTTFIEGDQPGCGWTGLRYHSSSWRDPLSTAGGLIVDLESYCYVVQAIGLGHGDWNQIMTKMTSGGDMYQTHIRKSRNFSLIVDFIGNSLGEIEANRKAVIDLIRPDLAEGQERIIRYQGVDVNGVEATHPIDIVCVPLPATLTDTSDLPTYQRAVLNFAIPSGLLNSAYNEGAELDWIADFPAEYIVKRDANGNWVKWGGAAYESLITGLNEAVTCMAEGPDGKIYVSGAFTDAGGTTDADYLACWNSISEAWESVITGNTEVASSIVFDASGGMYIGLYPAPVGAGYKMLAHWDGTTLTYLAETGVWNSYPKNDVINCIAIAPDGTVWVGGEYNMTAADARGLGFVTGGAVGWIDKQLAQVTCMAISPDGTKVYIGGTFTNVVGDYGDYLAYYDTTDSDFHTIGSTNLNGAVYALKFDNQGRLIVGGAFTNAGGVANADYIARWNGASWEALGSGVNNSVYTIVIANPAQSRDGSGGGRMTVEKVYVTGAFTSAGGLTLTDRVAVWSSGAWQPLDIDLPGTAAVRAILPASDGSLYIGGEFSTEAETPDENATCAIVSDRVYEIGVASASANTYPFMQVRGPGTLNAITNYSTGKSIMFDGLTLNAGEWINLFFDPLNLQFYGGWAGRGNLMRYVVPGSDYGDFYLRPGSNCLSLYMTNSTTDSGAWIAWTPLFWGLDGAVLE